MATPKTLQTLWYDEAIKAFQLAGMGESTQQTYARHVRKLIEFYNKDPRKITENELKEYCSSRINVKTTELCACSQFKIDKISVTKSHADYRSQPIIETLDESIGDAFDEVVENFLSPVFECSNKFGQIFVACMFGF